MDTNVLEVPVFGITITLCGGGGTITSALFDELEDDISSSDLETYTLAVSSILAMVLSHAVAGVDVMTPSYYMGIEEACEVLFRF